MTLQTRQLLTGLALACTLAITVACSGTSPSMNPTSPTALSGASAGANFSPNPHCPPDCPPPPPPPPPPDGTPCSPGYWKNHEAHFNEVCAAAALLPGDAFASCGDLLTAITCKGNSDDCGRHAAAAALNTVSGCVEED
jgi:hypothetical protein